MPLPQFVRRVLKSRTGKRPPSRVVSRLGHFEPLEDRRLLATGMFAFALAESTAPEATTPHMITVNLTTDTALAAGDTMSVEVAPTG
jgi:hypothetical protein